MLFSCRSRVKMKNGIFVLFLSLFFFRDSFAANRFWVGGTGNWSAISHWSLTTGGAGGASVPVAADNAIFDNNSGLASVANIVTMDVAVQVTNFDFSAVPTAFTLASALASIEIQGSLRSNGLANITYTGTINLFSTSAASVLKSSGQTWPNNFVLSASADANGITLFDNFTTSGNFTITHGLFSTAGKNFQSVNFISTNGGDRSINFNSSVVTILGTTWSIAAGTVPDPLTWTALLSTINLTNVTTVTFTGGGLTYANINSSVATLTINNTNTFSAVVVPVSSTLKLANSSTQTFASLNATGTCTAKFNLQAVSTAGAAASIFITGPTWTSQCMKITKVNAVGPTVYNLTFSTVTSSTGWNAISTNFFWIGNSGNWTDGSHWSFTSGGAAAGCVPTSSDLVFFNALSFTLPSQTVLVNDTAWFKSMNWTGITAAQNLVLDSSMMSYGNIVLNSNLTIYRNVISAAIQFNSASTITVNSADVDCNFRIYTANTTDNVQLSGDLTMSDSSSILIFNGNFLTMGNDISTGSIFTINDPGSALDLRGLNLSSSTINLKQQFSSAGDASLTFTAGTSNIYIGGDTHGYGNDLRSNGLTFYNVTLDYDPLMLTPTIELKQTVTGNNTFNVLEITPGSHVFLDSAGTQTIVDSLILKGNCTDSINLNSTDIVGTINQANISKATSVKVVVECVNINGINASGANLTASYSTNDGSNTNWTFPATAPVTSGFTVSGPYCLGDTTLFTNTSTCASGNASDFTSIWYFNDGSTGHYANPPTDSTWISYVSDTNQHGFSSGGTFNVTLVTTYINSCTDIFTQAVTIYDPNLFFNTSDIDKSICAGDSVSFEAGSSLSGMSYEFFLNGTSLNAPSPTDTLYSTFALADNDTVSVLGYQGGCPADSLPFFVYNVNPLPVFSWTISDADFSICDGVAVNFDGTSADATLLYRYFINGTSVTGYTLPGLYSSSALNDNDSISLLAKSTVGCYDTIDVTFNVDPLPTTSLSSSIGGSIICIGDPVLFTASGAGNYEFFMNGISQQGPGALNTWTTTSLTTGDVVTAVGYDAITGCSFTAPSSFSYTTLPLPTVTLTDSDADNSICSGNTVTFTASGGGLYEFFINGVSSFGPTATNNLTTVLNDNDAIYVTVTFGGCAATSTTTVFDVVPAPTTTLSSSDADQSICLGDNVIFTGAGATNYEFFLNGISQGPSSPANTFTTSSLTNGQTVSVTGESGGCTVSGSLLFTVLPLPSINLFSSDADYTICNGDLLTLTAANGVSYQLYVNGLPVGPPQASPTFTPALTVGSNTIYVQGTGINGCSALSSSLVITVNPIPTVTLSGSDADNIICAGETVVFTGSGSSMYQFFVNGIPQGSMSVTSTFTTSSLTNGQNVTVTGSSLGCTNTSSSIVMTVNPVPNVLLSNTDADNVFCIDQLVTFTATGATNYEFFVNGISQGPSSPANTLNSSTFATGTSTVTVVGDASGCTDNATNIVTINPLPVASLVSSDPDSLICSGTTVAYTAGGGFQYGFFINGISQGSPSTLTTLTSSTFANGDSISVNVISGAGCVSNASAPVLTVNLTPVVALTSDDADNQICVGDTVTFTGSGALTYEFFVNGVSEGPSSAASTFTTSSLAHGDDIYVVGTSNGCSSSSLVLTFSVFGPPVVSLINNGDTAVCTGEALDLMAIGGINFEYLINGIPVSGFTPTATYTGTVNNGDVVTVIGEANGCTMPSAESFTFVVNTYPLITSGSSDADNVICIYDSVTFTASSATTYEFAINGTVMQSGLSASYTTDALLNGDVVTVVGLNGDCPSTPDTYTFTVNSMNLDLAVSPSSLICEGDNALFTATGADQYQFFLNGISQGPLSTTNTYSNSSLADDDQVTFTGFSTTTTCLQDWDAYILMDVSAQPVITASTAPDFCEGDSVILTSNHAYGNQWTLNGTPIPGATDTFYVVYNSGSYGLENKLGGNGNIWSFGWNASGAFGDGTNFNNSAPQEAISTVDFDEISSGADFILGVTTTGLVYGWGQNGSGQLGNGTFTAANLPQAVPTLAGIKTVATTESSSMAVTSIGGVYVWGNNAVGQLATGSISIINFPFLNPALTNIDTIAGGKKHFVFLKNDGTVWTVGENGFGQLGTGTLTNSFTAVPTGLSNIVSIGAGEYHSFAISNTGDLYVWGNNGSGQLGLNDLAGRLTPTLSPLKNVVKAQGGAVHSLFLTSGKKVFSTGGNAYGQLGTGDLTDRITPCEIDVAGARSVSAGQYTSLINRMDNTVFGMGNNSENQLSPMVVSSISTPQFISTLDGVTFVEAGKLASHVIFGQGTTCVADTVNLNMIPVPAVSITAAGNVLSSSVTGTAYQWYLNGNPIPGANAQTITATANGNYSVEVTFGAGCSRTSSTYPVGVIGIGEYESLIPGIYPNPTTGLVTITFSNLSSMEGSFIQVRDFSGRMILSPVVITQTKMTVDLSAYAEGAYVVEVVKDGRSMWREQILKVR
jgi:alpha-tubulin suppressor-like RCC1 family protein